MVRVVARRSISGVRRLDPTGLKTNTFGIVKRACTCLWHVCYIPASLNSILPY
jgi:hypothetical protein